MDISKIDSILESIISRYSYSKKTIPIIVAVGACYPPVYKKPSGGWRIDPLTEEQIRGNEQIICELRKSIEEITSLSFENGDFLLLSASNSFSLRCNIDQIHKISDLPKVNKIYLNRKAEWSISEFK